MNKVEAQLIATHRPTAALAAWLGWPRGDLWVDYAMTENAAFFGTIESGESIETEKFSRPNTMTAVQAAALQPSDSRAWLILAGTDIQSGSVSPKTIAQLEMSYYTAPNDIRLMPFRIQIATRLSAITDNDLQSFIENDLRIIVLQKPNLKNSIAVAYRGASPAGRQLLMSELNEIDPGFATELQTTEP
jgi:hypothetical protein